MKANPTKISSKQHYETVGEKQYLRVVKSTLSQYTNMW